MGAISRMITVDKYLNSSVSLDLGWQLARSLYTRRKQDTGFKAIYIRITGKSYVLRFVRYYVIVMWSGHLPGTAPFLLVRNGITHVPQPPRHGYQLFLYQRYSSSNHFCLSILAKISNDILVADKK